MSDNKLHIYLYLPGTVRQAFTLYQQVFGVPLAPFPAMPNTDMITYGDMGMTGGEQASLIAYAALDFGNMLLMAGDKPVLVQPTEPAMRLHYAADSRQHAEQLFNQLARGGQIDMPLGEQPWGYSGQCTDQFGVAWELSVR